MTIEEIFEKWFLKDKNKQAGVDMWNSMAESFGEHKPPTFDDDNFLRLLQKHNMLKKDSLVLDVGSGTGKYALAIAEHCKEVVGIDFSPSMVEIAKQKAAEKNIVNVDFQCADWHQLDLKQNEWEGKFDLVIARMTPAVQSADTFQKLSLASRGWCVLSKPTRRTDPVSDEIRKLIHITEKPESSDTDIIYAFALLWQQGRLPHLDYEQQLWEMEKTLEQAYGLYINRMKTYRDLSSDEEEKIKQYLQSIAKDGLVHEDVNTTVTTIYWHV
jgi:SAM-dependent methyltransferase